MNELLLKLVKLRKSTVVSSQAGFTLLEMLVVIAVVGVLAAIAVPRFQNSLQRAQFVDVINKAGSYKSAVELCILKNGSEKGCNAGVKGIPPDLGASGNVDSVTVVDGEITVTADEKFGTTVGVANAAGQATTSNITYIMTPTYDNVGTSWAVDGTCVTAELCDN